MGEGGSMSNSFDYDAAKLAKTVAMDQVDLNADPAWKDLMLQLVRVVALTHPTFTTDDVMILYMEIEDAPKTHDLRALGPVMNKAAKAGYCVKTNTVDDSIRPSNHQRPLAIWRSLIYCEGRT
jgi:hypothetical protein